MADNTGRWYLGRVLGSKAARITVLVVALVFAAGFWLLNEMGAIEPGTGVAVTGVVLFVIVAFPLAMFVGGAAEKKIGSGD